MNESNRAETGKLIGYARVSTEDQHLDLQDDALKKVGCERIFTDKTSGASANRPGLTDALGYLREGDVLVVWKLDRLGRSLKDLIGIVQTLADRGVGFRCTQDQIDTTTNGGKLIFHIFAALAEFERGILQERTKAGLAAARARGRNGGRPKVMTDKKAKLAQELRADTTRPVNEICTTLGISRATYYRYTKGAA
jgi:DNA invertase Pin-like site-specific DNA recombinase